MCVCEFVCSAYIERDNIKRGKREREKGKFKTLERMVLFPLPPCFLLGNYQVEQIKKVHSGTKADIPTELFLALSPPPV